MEVVRFKWRENESQSPADEGRCVQVRELEEQNAALMQRALSVEGKHANMLDQVSQISHCLQAKTAENERLMSELDQMRQNLSVSPVTFECTPIVW